jgi:hypothetical protein
MNSPAFLLALAPAASAVAGRAVSAAKSTSESFVSMLGNVFESPANTNAIAAESKPTLAETLQSLAQTLRNWLSEQGAGDDFAIDFHLAPDGESQLNLAGEDAHSVQELLAIDSSWLDKLRQLASTMQVKSAQLSRDYTSPSVTIQIDPQRAVAY